MKDSIFMLKWEPCTFTVWSRLGIIWAHKSNYMLIKSIAAEKNGKQFKMKKGNH